MRVRSLFFALAVPAIVMAQTDTIEQRIKGAQMILGVERDEWRKASTALELGPVGLNEAEDLAEWAAKVQQAQAGKALTPLVREYLVGRWRARHRAITLRYTVATSEAHMQASFSQAGWTSYKEWQEFAISLIAGIDQGRVTF